MHVKSKCCYLQIENLPVYHFLEAIVQECPSIQQNFEQLKGLDILNKLFQPTIVLTSFVELNRK